MSRLITALLIAMALALATAGCGPKEGGPGVGSTATPAFPTAPSSYASTDGSLTYSLLIGDKACPNPATTGTLTLSADGAAVLTVRATGDISMIGSECVVQGSETSEVVVNGRAVPGARGGDIVWANCYGRMGVKAAGADNVLTSTGKTSVFGSLQFTARVKVVCNASDGTPITSVEGALSQTLPK